MRLSHTAGGATVELWGAPKRVSGDLKYLVKTTADKDGKYWFSRSITEGYRFAAQSNELNSEEVRVSVMQVPVFMASSPSKGVLSLSVMGDPRASGQKVTIQRWTGGTGGKWVNIWAGTTGKDNMWRANPKVASHSKQTVRAFIAGYTPDGLLPGYSDPKWITVK